MDHPVHNALVSLGLLSSPVWMSFMHEALQDVSLICGAVIGLTTVYRLYKKEKKSNAD